MDLEKVKKEVFEKFGEKIKIFKIEKKRAYCNCQIHGKFDKVVYDLLKSKYGCTNCAKEITKKARFSNTKEFLNKVKIKFPDYDYDYSLVDYKNNKEKITIICKEHGKFKISPNDFLQGEKCKECSKLQFKKIFENKIESKFNNIRILGKYNGMDNKIEFKCIKHGTQNIMAKKLYNGCPKCNNEKRILKKVENNKKRYLKLFKEKFGEKFTYLKYTNAKNKMEILCNEHNVIFHQIPYSHLKHNGCPLCKNYTAEKNFFEILKNRNIDFKYHHSFFDLRDKLNLSYDFYIPNKKLLIELNGEQHYKPVRFGNISLEIAKKNLKVQRHHDWLKRKYAKENNIKLLIIHYSNFNKLDNITFD